MRIIPPTEAEARADLAAAFRWAARLDWHESIANHFSLAISEDRCRFLMNPNGRHFSRVRASELLLLDARDESSTEGPGAPDPTAWYLHAHLHRRLPQAHCILHTHMPHATALCCLKDFELLMLDQNACRFHDRVAYDRDYDGMALSAAEGERVAVSRAARRRPRKKTAWHRARSTARTSPSHGTSAAIEPWAPQIGTRSCSCTGTSNLPGERWTTSR